MGIWLISVFFGGGGEWVKEFLWFWFWDEWDILIIVVYSVGDKLKII